LKFLYNLTKALPLVADIMVEEKIYL
jgi:hypothetical protein